MTRETKVGLVVGTGIILLIGIVVSDHLSSQQRGQQQTAAPPGYTDLANGQPRSINPQGVRPLTEQNNPAPQTRSTLPLPETFDAHGNRLAPQRNNNAAPGLNLNNVNDGANPPVAGGNLAPDRAAPPAPGNNASAGANDAGATQVDRNLPPGLADALRRNNMLPEDPTPRLANSGGANAGMHATEPLIHHVGPGESLWAIAEKFYGNGRYYTEIAKANADKLLADGGVREGVRLVIPNKVIVIPEARGSISDQPPRTGGNVGERMAEAAGSNANNTNSGNNAGNNVRPAGKSIKVESGDSLSAIASRELGSIRHMQLIIDANRDQISDADDIKAGMTLRIPSLPAAPAPSPATPGRAETPARTDVVNPTYPSTPSSVPARVHKVQSRETFSSIARSRLGSDRRWRELYELNRDKVSSPDALREGIVLVLPPDAR